jgi:tetratricopeptide (TPR) repeat protein
VPEFTRSRAPVGQGATVPGAGGVGDTPGFHVPSPRQFPAVPQRLCGRDPELKALHEMLSGHDGKMPLTAVITGPAGIGKTALALRWLRRSGPFPDGQLYASFGDTAVESVQDVLGRWLSALSVPGEWIPPDGRERIALWRSVSAGRQIAVLIDDAPSAAAIGALLPGPGPAVAAATTRHELPAAAADGARFIRLKPLGSKAAVSLLEQVAGPKRIVADRDASRELAELCGRVPLALRCAAGVLAASPRRTVAGIIDILTAERGRLGAAPGPANTGSGGTAAVQAALGMSYDALDPPTARAYHLLGLYPGPEFGSGPATATLGMSWREALAAIDALRHARLLDQAGRDRYRMHDLVRVHARALADVAEPEETRHAAEERIIGWHLQHAIRARQLLQPCARCPRHGAARPPGGPVLSTPGQALNWLDQERLSLRAAVVLAARQDNPVAAWQLAGALRPLWRYRGHYGEQLKVSRAGLDAARACTDQGAQARMHDHIGVACYHLGQFDEAARSFTRGRALWRDLGDKHRQALSLLWLGRVAAARGDPETAITLHQHVLANCQEDDVRQAALARIDLGRALAAAGRAGEASGLLSEAIRVLDDGADPYNLARARAALGCALLSRPALARALLDSALAVMEQLGAQPEQAEILQALAEAAVRAGVPGRARAYYQQAAGILPAGHPRARAVNAATADLPDKRGSR